MTGGAASVARLLIQDLPDRTCLRIDGRQSRASILVGFLRHAARALGDDPMLLGHSIHWESREICRVLVALGFDVDVIDIFAFDKAVQPYMKNVEAPGWQKLIEAGLLMDITDQPFVKNYDPGSVADAGSFDGKAYAVNLGRVGYSGLYYNKDLFAANGVAVPTKWSELVAACQTFKAKNIGCMTAGGKDGWPIFVEIGRAHV